MTLNKYDIQKNGIKNIIASTIYNNYGIDIKNDYDSFILIGANDLNIGINYTINQLMELYEVVEYHILKIEGKI